MIRWGIIGAGKIAARFVRSLQYEPNSLLYAVSCRTLQKAEAFAQEYPAVVAYGSYDELLNDPNVDAVYITLPHGYHYLWSIKAIKRGKAVLVEKPAGINALEIEGIRQQLQVNRVLWMEAMKTRFTPLYRFVHQQIRQGKIGDVIEIHAVLNSMQSTESIQNSYLSDPVYGGALLDCGCYCATWITDFAQGKMHIDDIVVEMQDGYDLYTMAKFHMGNISASLETAINRSKKKEVLIKGTKGYIRIPELHRPTYAEAVVNGVKEELCFPYKNDDFYSEIEHFTEVYAAGKTESDIMSVEDSFRTMKLLDIIKDASTPDPQ